MNLHLDRLKKGPDGIFGQLSDPYGNLIAYTLEHAYLNSKGGYDTKVPLGAFLCVRGWHRLEGMAQDFLTFEITGVKGHAGLLFHAGNYNKDSSGCILLGEGVSMDYRMIYNSKKAFDSFLKKMNAFNPFTLFVHS